MNAKQRITNTDADGPRAARLLFAQWEPRRRCDEVLAPIQPGAYLRGIVSFVVLVDQQELDLTCIFACYYQALMAQYREGPDVRGIGRYVGSAIDPRIAVFAVVDQQADVVQPQSAGLRAIACTPHRVVCNNVEIRAAKRPRQKPNRALDEAIDSLVA